MFRIAVGALSGLLAALACASAPAPAPAPPRLAPEALAERLARVSPGQPSEAARAAIGHEPVARPGHPDAPFPTPLRRLRLLAPDGRDVQVDLYVVAAHAAEGCPDVQATLAPVVHVDGVVAASDWRTVETHWRAWGGELAALRAARTATRCDAAEVAPTRGPEAIAP